MSSAKKITKLLQNGLAHHQAGRLQEAETAYQAVLQKKPKQPDALHLLGVVAHQTERHKTAIKLIKKAIAINSTISDFHNNCGEAYRALHKHDLAIACYEKALALQANYVDAHNNCGLSLIELGQYEAALLHFKKALTLKPSDAEIHNNMGNALQRQGQAEMALACFEKALTLKPGVAETHNNMGGCLNTLGQHDSAIAHYEKALSIKPDYVDALNNLANVYLELGSTKEAIICFKQVLSLKPDSAITHNSLAICLNETGKEQEAITHYEQAIMLEPNFAEAHNNLGICLKSLARDKEAITHYEQALALKPDYASALYNLVLLNPKQEHLATIEKHLADPNIPEADAIYYHYALGVIFENTKSYDETFKHYNRANTLRRKQINHDAQAHSSYIDKLINVYSKKFFQQHNNTGSDSERPVFIIGMPRSGTTLIEQILSSHPHVYGAGELVSLTRIERAISEQYLTPNPYPECMTANSNVIAKKYADEYLEELNDYSQDMQRITDKMPDNFLRIGLIKTLFPKAHIVHCRRNALDTCISIFLNYFVKGNEYAFDLAELGQYYLDYERIMSHWHKLFSTEIFDVQYEELITHQEEISKQLIKHIGLEWDDVCLDFHKNKRAVKTASRLQVRQPIYKNAIARWKQYEQHLGPLLTLLHHHT